MHVNLRYTATLSRRTLDAQQLDSISTACGKRVRVIVHPCVFIDKTPKALAD